MTRTRLALVGLYPIDGVPQGGAEKVCQQLAAQLARRDDLDVHVICPALALGESRVIEVDGLHVHAVACGGRLPAALRLRLTFRPRLQRVLRTLAPDIAHAQAPGYGLWCIQAGVPTVCTVHGVYAREVALRKGLRWLVGMAHLRAFEKALREARFIISINPYAQEALAAYTQAEFVAIPNPVEPRFFQIDAARAEDGRILCVGLLIPRKCVLELLEAFRSVVRDYPHARLRLVGASRDEAYVRELRDYVAGHGLEEVVRFLGTISEGELLEEYARACMLVLMTRQETAPGSIAEAMAAAKPVVSNRLCGIPYMVDDGRTGLLADADDVEGFAGHMRRLLGDPDLAREMGRRGREKALREFHPDRVVEATVEVYRRVRDEWGA